MKHLYDWNIIGHDTVISALEQELSSGNLAHAYLFAGSENTGKFTAAKTMSQILQCENNFCHECPSCREIEKGCHSDTIEIPDNGESIKIEEVRNILSSLYMSKNSRYRILLVKNIERMTLESANAMLKTLEDPPENVLFLLTTNRLKEILPTIISRVRVYNFNRLPENRVREFIHGLYPLAEEELLSEVSSFSMGRPGKAVQLMRDPATLDEVRKMFDDISVFIKKPDPANEFGYIAQVVQDAKDKENDKIVRDFLDIFIALLRKELLDNDKPAPERKKLVTLIKETQKSQDLLKRNVNARLLLENLMLHL
jgi:DNA polymerase III subunit delta'